MNEDKCKISVLSDLHIGNRDDHFLGGLYSVLRDQEPDLIINAGDDYNTFNEDGSYRILSAMREIAPTFKVKGNHCFYNSPVTPLDDVYLNQNNLIQFNIYDQEYAVIGNTLWTNFFDGDPMEMFYAKRTMNDYNYIDVEPIDLFNINKICEADIFEQIKEFDSDVKIIVVTHHAPVTESIADEFLSANNNGSFVNNYGNQIASLPENVKLWVHGHVHHSVDKMIGNCRVLCNPRGYAREHYGKNWRPKLIEV